MIVSKTVAVIPARKGSKRFPKKNRAKINGESLVEIAIKCAIDAQIFDQIVLSTDDNYFFNLAERFSMLEIRKRPKKISGNTATPYEVLQDILDNVIHFDHVRFCYLQPTSPLRQPSDIISSNSENAASIYHDKENILNSAHNVGAVLKNLQIDYGSAPVRHKLSECYFNGLFYWIDAKILGKQKNLFGKGTSLIETPIEKSIDIDFRTEFISVKKKIENSLV